MKLPDVLTGFMSKKEETKEYFFSLYLDTDAAAAAVWHIDAAGTPKVASFAHAVVADDSWESRTQVVDRLLSAAEEKVGTAKAIAKTVFGMPGAYLTAEGNITEAVRPHLKKLSHMLELAPVGFVPLSQAIAFSLKKDEGVPPSVILIGCSGTHAHVTLFRVGNVTHEDNFMLGEDAALSLEAVLKKHQDGDVLPSRILIYGGNAGLLEETRSKLLKHPWPTRTNFLHFPKIEIITTETLLTAVSLAGASELSHDIGENQNGEEEVSTVVAQPTAAAATVAAAAAGVASKEEAEDDSDDEEDETEDEDDDDDYEDEEEDEEDEEDEEEDDGAGDEEISEEEGIVHDELPDTATRDELSNVEMVTPESLGFRREDVLEAKPTMAPKSVETGVPAKSGKPRIALPITLALPHISFDKLPDFRGLLSRLPPVRRGGAPVIIGVVVLLIILASLYYTLPRATVTVLVASQSVDESTSLTVDPAASVADASSKIIPGRTQEQSVSGEKTIAVSGKKNIGDPAKGTVTIYNKVTSGRTFPKGTVLTTGGVAFTLDSDVSVASASESIGSITFGKANASVTARDIGPNGNVSASSEFSFSTVSSSQVSARNEAAFTGGTSKQVTVVSRADQDGLVKALTDELVGQAKERLLSVAGGERLIDATIKTEVSEKVFDAELDEEASQLHGKVTVKVTGISISDSDINAALAPLVEEKIPAGYQVAPEQTKVDVSQVSVKKDGTITLVAKLTAVSLPEVDQAALKKKLAGRGVDDALNILKETRGVSGAEFRFALSPLHSRLPLSSNNITITVMVQ